MFGRNPFLAPDTSAPATCARSDPQTPQEGDFEAMRLLWKAFKAGILPSISSFSRAFYEASDSNAHKRASPFKPGMHVHYMPPTELCYALGLTRSSSVNLGPFRVESVSKGNARLVGSDGYTSVPVSFQTLLHPRVRWTFSLD